jgi:hypothetical protein
MIFPYFLGGIYWNSNNGGDGFQNLNFLKNLTSLSRAFLSLGVGTILDFDFERNERKNSNFYGIKWLFSFIKNSLFHLLFCKIKKNINYNNNFKY